MGEMCPILVEDVILVGREEIERMKGILDELLEKITEKRTLDNKFETIHDKMARLDERVRNIETLLETAVRLIQELIFISSGETIAVKEEQASVNREEEEKISDLEEPPRRVNSVKIREEEEIARSSSWDILGQRPKVSLHDLERELERLFSRMAELEIAKEEGRITQSEYLDILEALKEKKDKIRNDLDRLFEITRK